MTGLDAIRLKNDLILILNEPIQHKLVEKEDEAEITYTFRDSILRVICFKNMFETDYTIEERTGIFEHPSVLRLIDRMVNNIE